MNNQRKERIDYSIETLRQAKNDLAIFIESEKAEIKAFPENNEKFRDDMRVILEYLEKTDKSLNKALSVLENAFGEPVKSSEPVKYDKSIMDDEFGRRDYRKWTQSRHNKERGTEYEDTDRH